MSRLQGAFEGGGKLVAFVVGGFPSLAKSYQIACAAIEGGADVLEVGLPFSDPVADGQTIQAASHEALKGGMNTDRYFTLISRIRAGYSTPLVCLTYYNVILRYGLEKFARNASKAGLDGVIVPDLPVEEAGELQKHLRKNGIDIIFLVAETTPKKRIQKITAVASGFIYVVALLGTTGARSAVSKRVKKTVSRLKAETDIPVAVGFGVSSPKNVRQVISYGADAAIVGSAIVSLASKEGVASIKPFVSRLKSAACKG